MLDPGAATGDYLRMGKYRFVRAIGATALSIVPVLVFMSCSSGAPNLSDSLQGPVPDSSVVQFPEAATTAATTPDVGVGPSSEAAIEAASPAGDASDATSSNSAQDADACEAGLSGCGSRCVDLQADPNNCGSCGHLCGGTGSTCNAGTCACTGSFTLCPQQNQCFDLTSDSSNCGFCGYGCQGGNCAGSLCQPTTIVSGSCFGGDIAIDMTNIYWTNGVSAGAVYFKPFASAANPQPISTSENIPSGIALGSNGVYWVDFNSGAVGTSEIVNGNFQIPDYFEPASGMAGPIAVAVDTHNIYWVNRVAGTVNQLPLSAMLGPANADAGTPPTVLASGRDQPTALVVDSANIYWVDFGSTQSPTGTVNMVPIGGNNAQVVPLATGQSQPNDIATSDTDTYVYWVNQAQRPNGSVQRVPKAGGTMPALLATTLGGPTGIAVDAQYVYWTNFNDGTVQKVALAGPSEGGAPYTLATGQDTPQAITVDSVSVYWASHGTGNILKVAKGY